MHRELSAQFLVTRMEIAHVSFLPAHHRINNQECRSENARHITLALDIRSQRATAKFYPKTEEIFLCIAILPIYHLQEQWPALISSSWIQIRLWALRCAKPSETNAWILPSQEIMSTSAQPGLPSIRAHYPTLMGFCKYGTDLYKHVTWALGASVSAWSIEVMSCLHARWAHWDLTVCRVWAQP